MGGRLVDSKLHIEKTALSLGERVSGNGAFTSRRRTGEGFLPFPAFFAN